MIKKGDLIWDINLKEGGKIESIFNNPDDDRDMMLVYQSGSSAILTPLRWLVPDGCLGIRDEEVL